MLKRLGLLARPANARLLVLCVILFAFALRISGLGLESYWFDEASSVSIAEKGIVTLVLDVSKGEATPPLYFIVLGCWIRVFGYTEMASRAFSVFVGVLSVALSFRIATTMFSPAIGLMTASLVAISPFHISYSQEARAYALAMMLTLASMFLFLKYLETPRHSILATLVLTNTLLGYTHYFGLFIILTQNLHILAHNRSYRRTLAAWALWQGFLLLLLALMVPVVLSQIAWTAGLRHATTSSWGYFLKVLTDLMGPHPLTALILCAFGTTAFLQWLPRPDTYLATGKTIGSPNHLPSDVRLRNERFALLLAWIAVPLLLSFGVNRVYPIVTARHLIIILPALLLATAVGFCQAFRTSIVAVLAGGVFAIATLFITQNLAAYYTGVDKEEWRDVTHLICTQYNNGDIVVFEPAWFSTGFDYYAKRLRDSAGKCPIVDTIGFQDDNLGQVISRLDQHTRAWLILPKYEGCSRFMVSPCKEPEWKAETTLNQYYQKTYEQQFAGLNVALYDLRSPR